MAQKDEMLTPGVVINVDEAVVRTATIEIRMLTIDRRKVTLSLFRQFKQRYVLDPETGQQCGVLWGLINYFWSGCNERGGLEARHLHVLWQDGQELFRDCVYPDRKGHLYSIRQNAMWYHSQSWKMALLAVHAAPDSFVMKPLVDGRYRVTWKSDAARSWNLSKEANIGYHRINLIDWRRDDWTRKRELEALHEAIEHDKFKGASPQELWKSSFEIGDHADELDIKAKKLNAQWECEYQVLAQLPQLFIAG